MAWSPVRPGPNTLNGRIMTVAPAQHPARAVQLLVEDHDVVLGAEPMGKSGADESGPSGDEDALTAWHQGRRGADRPRVLHRVLLTHRDAMTAAPRAANGR